MNDLGKPRGSMAADPATKLRVAEAAPAAAAAKDDDDDDDGPRYFRDSAADTTTPPKPPLGAPTEHVLEVCHNNTEWLLCFEEAADLVAWRDAIHAARLDAKPPVPPEIFDLECASTTSNDAAARSRFGVFRCAGDCRGALKAVLRAVRDDEKAKVAQSRKALERAASDGEADGDATVALDGAVLADIDRAVRRDAARRFKPKRDACDAARRDALAGLEKVVAVVRKAYAEARVDLPPDVELEVPPPPPLSGGAIVDVWSAETFARDAAEVVARAFKDDAVDANLSGKIARASLLNRAARDAAAGSDAEALDARIRLATRPGDFYYPVAGHDYFFSAVTPARERQRLLAAGFAEATISACNVVSFRDILGSAVVAKLERAALRLVDADDHLGLQRLLALGAARATGEKARRTARLFDPDRTLVDQAARYLISVARR
mmetsp:Transcript_15971/g.52017  ORF Transcript_15971/g.52017 Transcript_15971/m.52017 type:complete len:436 (-) Transcript_15971:18-1325(-)